MTTTNLEIVSSENITEAPKERIVICIANQDWYIDYLNYGLTFDSTESEILERLRGAIEEKFGESIRDNGGWLYKTRKALDSRNIYIIPNSTAGNIIKNNLLIYVDFLNLS